MSEVFTFSDNWIAITLALIAAACIALGTVLRDKIESISLDSNTQDSLGAITSAIKRPVWWAGVVVSLLGYVFQAAALVFGSLILVQPLIAFAFLFAIPIGAAFVNRKVTSYEWFWAATLTVSIVAFIVIGRPQPGVAEPGRRLWFLVLAGVAALVFVLILIANRVDRKISCGILGISAGIVFGVVALLTKQVITLIHKYGYAPVINHWELYALITAAIVATSLQQASFAMGNLHNSLPGMSVAEPIVAVILGMILLKEYFDISLNSYAILGIIAACMVVSIIMLAKHE